MEKENLENLTLKTRTEVNWEEASLRVRVNKWQNVDWEAQHKDMFPRTAKQKILEKNDHIRSEGKRHLEEEEIKDGERSCEGGV